MVQILTCIFKQLQKRFLTNSNESSEKISKSLRVHIIHYNIKHFWGKLIFNH